MEGDWDVLFICVLLVGLYLGDGGLNFKCGVCNMGSWLWNLGVCMRRYLRKKKNLVMIVIEMKSYE